MNKYVFEITKENPDVLKVWDKDKKFSVERSFTGNAQLPEIANILATEIDQLLEQDEKNKVIVKERSMIVELALRARNDA